jgi:omega-amidase
VSPWLEIPYLYTVNVTLIQTNLFWEDREKNLAHFEKLISAIPTQTDLIVLPEMFTTGFTMNPEKNAEQHLGKGFEFMKKMAAQKKATICGSISTKDEEHYFNRLYWVDEKGVYDYYDKRHLFRMGKEEQYYRGGTNKIIKEVKGFKVCPLICYDLRFPIWSRNKFDKETNTWDYDVLIYVANWPEVRNHPWKQLLIARAIENQCYVVGVNRIGKDGNDVSHSGDSVVVNPRGEIISHTKANEESVETLKLDKAYLDEFRKVFPVGLDADDFEIK